MIEPFKRTTDKVALIGMATTSRHLAPWGDEAFEIWGLNEAYHGAHKNPQGETYMRRWTRWFQMHPKWDYMRENNFNHLEHPRWLTNAPWTTEELEYADDPTHKKGKEFLAYGATIEQRRNVDFPIYMLEYDEAVPGSVPYPFQEIIDSFGVNAGNVRYFTNSFGYMVALAIFMGYKEIHTYGFEMASETEYASQKANAEFWEGIAIGRGVKLVNPEGCSLLGTRVELYGYEKIPGITLMHLEIERNNYHNETVKAQAELERVRGMQNIARSELEQARKTNQKGRLKRAQNKMSALVNEEVKALIKVNGMNVAKQVIQKHIADLKGLPDPGEIKLIDLGRKVQIE